MQVKFKVKSLVEQKPYLTKEKVYDVICEYDNGCYLINANGGYITAEPKKYFEVVEEKKNDNMKNNKKELLEQKVESLESQVKELKEELKELKMEEESEKVWWKPKDEDEYWSIRTNGTALISKWSNDTWDNGRYNIGNCFKTKEEAERELFERELRFKLKKFAYENNEEEINWNDDEKNKFFIYYGFGTNKLEWCIDYLAKNYGQIYFTSKEVAEKAIETFKDDLIRYFTSDK